MAGVVDIVSGHDVSIHTHCGNQPNESKLAMYHQVSCYNHFKHL